MTTADLSALLDEFTLNTSNVTLRGILADALEDAGETLVVKLLRSNLPLQVSSRRRLLPALEVSESEEGFINCRWGSLGIGGCWVSSGGIVHDSSGSVLKENTEVGDLVPYEGTDMTGFDLPNTEWFAPTLELTDDEASDLVELLQVASRIACKEH